MSTGPAQHPGTREQVRDWLVRPHDPPIQLILLLTALFVALGLWTRRGAGDSPPPS